MTDLFIIYSLFHVLCATAAGLIAFKEFRKSRIGDHMYFIDALVAWIPSVVLGPIALIAALFFKIFESIKV